MSQVFVVDTNRQPLMPCTPARARLLLSRGKAAVLRRIPFTIILKEAKPEAQYQILRLKLDPGSQMSGFAIVNDVTGRIVFAAEMKHRGSKVRDALISRRMVRRNRRKRHTRYRQARFFNRRRPPGWLPPSLFSRLANLLTWVNRLRSLCPISHLSMELVRFDTQAIQNPEISGIQYQEGTLGGYELRQYLLEKWQYKCAYCQATNTPLEIDHILARSRGGSNRTSNLALACHLCNERKGNLPIEVFLAKRPEVLQHILAQATAPLRDAAAVNTTRWALYERLVGMGLPVEVGSGGRTKWNRSKMGLPKTHWLDAACVGASTPSSFVMRDVAPLMIQATGHGNRQMCATNRYGFPTKHRSRKKKHFGFQTGDFVRAHVPAGLKTSGRHVGRVTTRASGYFDIETAKGGVAGVSYRYCSVLHHSDGYSFELARVKSSSLVKAEDLNTSC